MNKWSAWSDTRRPGTVEVERGFEGTGKKDDESDRSDEGRRRRTWTMRCGTSHWPLERPIENGNRYFIRKRCGS